MTFWCICTWGVCGISILLQCFRGALADAWDQDNREAKPKGQPPAAKQTKALAHNKEIMPYSGIFERHWWLTTPEQCLMCFRWKVNCPDRNLPKNRIPRIHSLCFLRLEWVWKRSNIGADILLTSYDRYSLSNQLRSWVSFNIPTWFWFSWENLSLHRPSNFT